MGEGERTAKILRKHGWSFDSTHGQWSKPGLPPVLLLVMMEDPPRTLRRLGDEKCAREVERSYR